MRNYFQALALTLLLAGMVGGCGGGGGGGGPSEDTTAPTVSATRPARDATGVAITAPVTVTFSEAMEAASLTTATFSLRTDGTGVAGNVSCQGSTATFTPAQPLAYRTTYTATLTTGVRDVAGNALAEPYTWSFTTAPAGEIPTRLLQPADLVYQGAFRLPEDPGGVGWEWGGEALTYYPEGDLHGPADGFPGSLFGTGDNPRQYISEVSIPTPVISPTKNLEALNTAETLQGFHNILLPLFGEMEIPRAGLEYLPPQGSQTTGKLYFCRAQHMGEGETHPSHGWCELDLANPRPAGLWRIGSHWNYVTADYIFAIPQGWADAYTPGMYLATGRFRDGGQGAQGPTLFAYGPWNEGNPPPPGRRLPAVPLLLYGNVYTPGSPALEGYHHSDEWAGGAWLTAGDRAAVVFVGTKGQGNCWYGFADGTVWPDEPPYPPIPDPPNDVRGWWSSRFEAQMIFYDPNDLAAVAQGTMDPSQPQPYATLNIDPVLFWVLSPRQKHRVGAAAFDRAQGVLYVLELFGDGDRPLVHVWRIEG